MRMRRTLEVLLITACVCWGQGGGRGRGNANQQAQPPAQQPPAQPAAAPQAGRGGRGGGGGEPATSEFYNFETTAGPGQTIPDSGPVETRQKITWNGQPLAYTVRAGFMPVRNATTGQSEAHVFYTSYSKDGAEGAGRPIVFFFGGAPGVSAAWQEFGGLGPKRMKPAGEAGEGQPSGWADNPNTLLGQADLVFVNPVGTAFSRPDRPDHGPSFWNTGADIASLGEFVRAYLGRSNRSGSPLFLAGEDAGTGRVGGLAGYLHEHDIPVQGVALLSMSETPDAAAGDAQYITLLPSLVMSAWYHKKLAPDMAAMSAEQISAQARQFASREYLHALYKGDRMSAEERAKVIADLARFTGLSKQFVVSNDLRITLDRFNGELMREQHRALSPSDARVTGFVPPAAGGRGGGGFGFAAAPPIDFNTSNLAAPFLSSYESYLRRELTFTPPNDSIYYLMSGGVGGFTSTGNDDASMAAAFARNANLRLFVAINYYDLSAPFYATEYTLAHLNVAPEVRAHNITVSHYEAGQMTYLDNKELAKLQRDLASFVTESTSAHK